MKRPVHRDSVTMLPEVAARLVRLPLVIAAIVAFILLVGLDRLPTGRLLARSAVRLLLATYLLAGVLNLPRFPRTLRGPDTANVAIAWLLDMWSVIALVVASAVVVDGTAAGVL